MNAIFLSERVLVRDETELRSSPPHHHLLGRSRSVWDIAKAAKLATDVSAVYVRAIHPRLSARRCGDLVAGCVSPEGRELEPRAPSRVDRVACSDNGFQEPNKDISHCLNR
jgi:hypothetical protein